MENGSEEREGGHAHGEEKRAVGIIISTQKSKTATTCSTTNLGWQGLKILVLLGVC